MDGPFCCVPPPRKWEEGLLTFVATLSISQGALEYQKGNN